MNARSAALPVALLINTDSERSSILVLDLLDAGYRVVVASRADPDRTDLLPAADDRVHLITADIDDPLRLAELPKQVVARLGRLDEIIVADTGKVVHVPTTTDGYLSPC